MVSVLHAHAFSYCTTSIALATYFTLKVFAVFVYALSAFMNVNFIVYTA